MRIAVIGAGNIGGTLGTKWAEAGHHVVYGVRHPEPTPAGHPGQKLPAEAVADADVVVLAVPGGAAKEVLAALGPALAGKVVIDATNDVAGSGKLHALDELGDGALPVRAFNTLGWESFADPVVGGEQATLFYAAPEGRAKDVADQLIREVGLEPVWVGGVDELETIDSLTRLWFTLAFQRGLGRRIALRLLRD
jgi:predicted dinucleotide-binding enzyme